jgi:organic radical activating enzyme
MNCEILRTLYLKANGEIVCNDDLGEQVTLGMPKYESSRAGLARILKNDRFSQIRTAFAKDTVPWPGICENCALLRMHEPIGADLLSQGVIDKLQVESSLACALRCPSCSNGRQIRDRQGPIHLPTDWFETVLQELADADYQINWIEFCGQGEPLNHPDFSGLVALARRIMPAARIRLITNGNHAFMRKIGSTFIDETIVSIDGARQRSYEQYRVNGRVERAIQFLQGSVDSQVPRGGKVIWKYILFTSNDSDDEIREAQEIAAELGVSRLWFVHGHGPMASQRFTFANATAVPVTRPFVKVESHPSYNAQSRSMNAVGGAEQLDGPPAELWLDHVVAHSNDTLTLVGWLNSHVAPFEGLHVLVSGEYAFDVHVEVDRPDVLGANPDFRQEKCGFEVLLNTPGLSRENRIELTFEVRFADAETARLRRVLDFA